MTGRKADALLAAHFAAEAALRLVKPGNEVNYHLIGSDQYFEMTLVIIETVFLDKGICYYYYIRDFLIEEYGSD